MTNKSFRDYINLIENAQRVGARSGSKNIEVGDKVTFWYNKFNPNYEGIVRQIVGDGIMVYTPGSNEIYRLTKADILSHTKKGVSEEQLEETSPEAIAKINQITRR